MILPAYAVLVLLDASVSSIDEQRNIPIYLRASEIRMVGERRGTTSAKKATFSTSEFLTPHYHVGASDAYLQDITPRDEDGKAIGPVAYGYKAKDATMNVQGVPIFYWPYVAGDTSKNDIPLRKLSVGYNKTYGASIETTWDLFGLAGQREPKGVHADLDADYFSERGPAGGIDTRYTFPGFLGQLFQSHIMQDNGTDRLGIDRDNLDPADGCAGRGRDAQPADLQR